MASAAEFLKTYAAPAPPPSATTPSPDVSAAPQKKSASEFISRETGKPFTAKKTVPPPEAEERSLAAEMVEATTDPETEAWDTLAADWKAAQGKSASPEAMKKYKESGFVDHLKSDAKEYLATAKLPLDIAGAAFSPVAGLIKGLAVTPAAAGLEATQSHEHPSGYVAAYTDEKGKKHEAEVLTPEQIKAYQKQLTKPHKSQQDYFKESENRPRPQITSSTKDISTGLMGLVDAGLALWIPEDVAAFRRPAGPGGPGGAGSVKVPRSAFGNFTTRPGQSAEEFAQRKVGEALKVGGVSKEQAIEKLSKPGMSISDLGDDKMLQISEQAGVSGEGRRLASNLYVDERLKGRQARVAEAVNKLANDKNMYEHLDELKDAQIKNARPLYQDAFSHGGSEAPLVKTLEEHFDTTSRGVREAQQELSDAENAITQVHGRYVGESDNVYTTNARNAAIRAANYRKMEAEEKFEKAVAARDDALERLNVAQDHKARGVKGGMWSPRLQQLQDDEFVQAGTARGIRVQQLEALAEGEQPQLTEWALKPGSNLNEPVPTKVPNLRLLDAQKRGMDAILYENYWNKETGRLELNELGRAQQKVRDKFVKEVDRLAEEQGITSYKAAREAWGGPERIMELVHDAKNYKKIAPEMLAKKVAKMTPGELEGYRIGVVRDLADDVAKGTTQALTVARSIVDNTNHIRQLKIILGEEQTAHIVEMAEREIAFAKRGSRISGGSKTGHLAEGKAEFQTTGSEVVDDMLDTLSTGGGFGIVSPKHLALGFARRWGQRVMDGMTQARRDAVGKLLFSSNREDNLAAIEMIYDEGMMTLPSYSKTKKALFGGAVSDLAHTRGQSKESDAEDETPESVEPASTP